MPRLLRVLLGAVAAGYSLVVRLRNFFYSSGVFKAHCVDRPVFCIGNITVGGTGKTPLVVWLFRRIVSNSRFQISNTSCAILTRGYKAAHSTGTETDDFKDEVAVLGESCPGANVVVNPNRVVGAAQAIGNYNAKVLIMDDGFQHRRMARDLDIVAIDATGPFGYGRMFPAGLLREPVSSLKRAGAVVITRCDQVSEAELDSLERKLHEVNPQMPIARSVHSAVSVTFSDFAVIPAQAGIQTVREEMDSCLRRNDKVEQLRGRKVFAFCGIGNPDAFLKTIKKLGCELLGYRIYDDHYHYTQSCFDEIYAKAEGLGADLILTTKKDWTKIAPLKPVKAKPPIAYLEIEIKFLSGEEKLTALIDETLAGKIQKTVND